jgi:hypothetical protein
MDQRSLHIRKDGDYHWWVIAPKRVGPEIAECSVYSEQFRVEDLHMLAQVEFRRDKSAIDLSYEPCTHVVFHTRSIHLDTFSI